MKLTKYEHACFIAEEQGKKLIVDPGMFGHLPDDLSNTAAVVITHVHADHFALENIEKIAEQNPDVVMYAATEAAAQIEGAINPDIGTLHETGPFRLVFYGETHEFIREGIPQPANIGVNINNLITYPGDSYSQDPNEAKLLMAPAGGPWLRVKEACEYIARSNTAIIVPTHDAVLSEAGKQTHDNHFRTVSEGAGKQYRRLQAGESLDV